MARPAKAVKATSRHNTKEDIEIRNEAEKRIRGGVDELIPPEYLTDSQKQIFYYIVRNLKDAEILGNLDLYILTFSAVTIDKMIDIDKTLNDEEMMSDPTLYKAMVNTRSTLAKDFFRCINELSLSPQARAKISIANVKAIKESKNPLLEALDL